LGPWIEGERAREPRGAHPAREVGVLKRHGAGEGEGELGADFTSLVDAETSSALTSVLPHQLTLRHPSHVRMDSSARCTQICACTNGNIETHRWKVLT
jgi:hypothetical protein